MPDTTRIYYIDTWFLSQNLPYYQPETLTSFTQALSLGFFLEDLVLAVPGKTYKYVCIHASRAVGMLLKHGTVRGGIKIHTNMYIYTFNMYI